MSPNPRLTKSIINDCWTITIPRICQCYHGLNGETSMSFLLPFTVLSEDRVKRFKDNMKYATIFCLTEMGRNKGGLIRKKPPEEIVFVTEVCYPIWRTPWGKTSLLFDGLGLANTHCLSTYCPI